MGSLQPEQIAAMSGGKMSPEMAKLATDMVKQMSADDMRNMFGMISSFENQSTANTTPITSQSTSATSGSTSAVSRSTSRQDNQDLRPGSMATTPDLSSISSEMQEQMKQHMKNPMMTQVIYCPVFICKTKKCYEFFAFLICMSFFKCLDGYI